MRIIDTAMMIISRQGYAGTKLDDVAAHMQMTRGAIYGHFSTKAKLYEEILRYSQAPLYRLLEDAKADLRPADGVIYRFMVNWLQLLDRDPRHRASTEIFLNKSEMTDELDTVVQREMQLTRDMISGIGQIVRRGIDEGDIRASVQPRRAAISVYAQLMGLMQTWLFNPRLFSLRNHAEAMVQAFVQGLFRVEVNGLVSEQKAQA